jgi:hypothetical protein
MSDSIRNLLKDPGYVKILESLTPQEREKIFSYIGETIEPMLSKFSLFVESSKGQIDKES